MQLGYYEQVPTNSSTPGDLMYNLTPLPVKDGVAGRPHAKRVPLQAAEMDGLFQLVDQSILKSGSFTEQLTQVLTAATLIKLVADENYNKIDEHNVVSPLTAADWEIVNAQELVSE